MQLGEMVIIFLHITSVMSRKRIRVRDDSVENILYYKDCNHKAKAAPQLMRLTQPKEQECKMSCKMCCGDECPNQNNSQPIIRAQVSSPKPSPMMQLPLPLRTRFTNALKNLKPIPTRRNFNAREYIKNLISHDGDIRSILKDLVRVTMQKVDLMRKIETGTSEPKESVNESDENESELYN